MKKSYSLIVSIFVLSSFCFSDIVLIANKASGIKSISKSELVSLYSGRGKRIGSKSVKPVMLKSGDVHEGFCKIFLKRSPSSVSKIWKKLVFTGKASMIKTLSNEADMIRQVSNHSEYIGYIERKNLNDDVIIVEVR